MKQYRKKIFTRETISSRDINKWQQYRNKILTNETISEQNIN